MTDPRVAPKGAGLPAQRVAAGPTHPAGYPSDSAAVRDAARALARNYPSMRATGPDGDGEYTPTETGKLVAWVIVSAAAPHLRRDAFAEAADVIEHAGRYDRADLRKHFRAHPVRFSQPPTDANTTP